MSLAQEKNREFYGGKGDAGEYVIPFRFDDPSWLKVTRINEDGTTTAITTSQYSVTDGGPLGTAKLITSVAPNLATKLIIARRSPAVQNLSLTSNAPLPAKDLEKTLDQLAMAIIDRDPSDGTAISRALSFPLGEPTDYATRLPMPALRKGMFIGFDDTTGEMQARPLSVALHSVITQALAAIESARTTTITVLNNAHSTATNLLAQIPLFYKKEVNGGIKFGQVEGDPIGLHGINLQTHRSFPSHVASGMRSIVIGNSKAFGENSISIGNQSLGAGTFTTSVGTDNNATLQFGSAFGYNNHTLADHAVALGYGNSANYFSVAVGALSQASGQFSSAFGFENVAGGSASSSIGHQNNAANELANAFGTRNQATAPRSSAFGYGNTSSSSCSTAFGYLNAASQIYATAVGSENTASGTRSLAVGHNNRASGSETISQGIHNTASGHGTSAIGHGNTISGYWSVACGTGNNVPSSESTSVGCYNYVSHDRSAAFGRYNSVTAGDAGAIGMLTQASAGNSIAFGYGTIVGTECVTEMANIGYGSWARVRADGPSCTVSLSFGYERPAPTLSSEITGHEASGTLSDRMLSFRSDGYQLHIDVAVHGTIKTVSLPLS